MSLKAIQDAPCVICDNIIYAGVVTRPIKSNSDGISWAHLDCISPCDKRIPICKHWLKKGECIFQSSCLFRHPSDSQASSDSKLLDDVNRNRRGQRLRRRIFNDGRAGTLRRWIISVFGESYLKSGTGILDIAGGKGELAFELENLNGISTCVFDPRKLELVRYCRKLEFGYYHRNGILMKYNSRTRPLNQEEYRVPQQIRGYFEMSSNSSTKTNMTNFETSPGSDDDNCSEDIDSFEFPKILQNQTAFTDGLKNGRLACWTAKGLETGLNIADSDEDRSKLYPQANEIESFSEARNIVRNCSLIVGMHPDQAAEHILDFSIHNNKPCAFIPCCVYSKQFPRRKKLDGSPVRKYGELIEYLLDKLMYCMKCSIPSPSSAEPTTKYSTVNSWNNLNMYNLEESASELGKSTNSPILNFSQFGIVEMDFEGKNLMIFYLADRKSHVDPYEPQPHVTRGPATSKHWWALTEGYKNTIGENN